MEPLILTPGAAGDGESSSTKVNNNNNNNILTSPETKEFLDLERKLEMERDEPQGNGPNGSLDTREFLDMEGQLNGDKKAPGISRQETEEFLDLEKRLEDNDDSLPPPPPQEDSLPPPPPSLGHVEYRQIEITSEEEEEENRDQFPPPPQENFQPPVFERQLSTKQEFQSELETKLIERKRSMENADTASYTSSMSSNGSEGSGGLQLLEKRQFREFSGKDEYLYAIKEDLSEWFNMLYPSMDIEPENFMDKLETGEHLVRHANCVRVKAVELLEQIAAGLTRQKPPDFQFPEKDLPLRLDATPGTWFARDNVYNFIKFCKTLGVMECIRFETEDLVCRKNEKHVILTILDVARRGAKIGMLAPMLIQFEIEIDRDIAREEKERRKEEKEKKKKIILAKKMMASMHGGSKEGLIDGSGPNGSGLNGSGLNGSGLNGSGLNGSGLNGAGGLNGSSNGGLNGSPLSGSPGMMTSSMVLGGSENDGSNINGANSNNNGGNNNGLDGADGSTLMSTSVHNGGDGGYASYLDANNPQSLMFTSLAVEIGDFDVADVEDNDLDFFEEEEEEEEEEEGYAFPIGPMPQTIINDLKSLDEMVREMVSECQCPTQFPMVRISEGKYRIGDVKQQITIFVRILRNHVMVRVGGGWDTLQHYLYKHDPCRCKAGHKGTVGATFTLPSKASNHHQNGQVCYDRVESPNLFGSPKRRSSTTNLSSAGSSESRRTSTETISTGKKSTNLLHSALTNSNSYNPSSRPKKRYGSEYSPNSTLRPSNTVNVVTNLSNSHNLSNSSNIRSPSTLSVESAPKISSRASERSNSSGSFCSSASISLKSSKNSENSSNKSRNPSSNSSELISNPRNSIPDSVSPVSNSSSNSSNLNPANSGGDSGSEISDEGYKSSHCGIQRLNSMNEGKTSKEVSTSLKAEENLKTMILSSETVQSGDEIPEESQGAANKNGSRLEDIPSEVSSTISSSEDEEENENSSQAKKFEVEKSKTEIKESPVISEDDNLEVEDNEYESLKTDVEVHNPENLASSPVSKSRISELIANMKLPKFRRGRNKLQTSASAGNCSVVLNQQQNQENPSKTPKRDFASSTLTRPTAASVARSRSLSNEKSNQISKSAAPSPSPLRRNTSERRSYRAPASGSVTSRYMQAAEAYTASARANRTNSVGNGKMSGTWSSGSLSGARNQNNRQRPALTAETFRPPSAGGSYETSRWRRLSQSSNNSCSTSALDTTSATTPKKFSRNNSQNGAPSSTQSTPMKKKSSTTKLAEIEAEDDAILKRMEEILMTYKTKVESHLAAEGRELPKDIFEDFTTQWVNDSLKKNHTQERTRSATRPRVGTQRGYQERSLSRTSTPSGTIRTTPTWRKEYREGAKKESKIPMPVFFSPDEANIQ